MVQGKDTRYKIQVISIKPHTFN